MGNQDHDLIRAIRASLEDMQHMGQARAGNYIPPVIPDVEVPPPLYEGDDEEEKDSEIVIKCVKHLFKDEDEIIEEENSSLPSSDTESDQETYMNEEGARRVSLADMQPQPDIQRLVRNASYEI